MWYTDGIKWIGSMSAKPIGAVSTLTILRIGYTQSKSNNYFFASNSVAFNDHRINASKLQ